MARKVYGLHARDHLPGGADPIPATVIPYAYLRLSGQNSVTSGTSYNVDTVPGSLSGNSTDTDTFEIYTDVNSKKGIHVLRSGMYHWHWSAQAQENNGSNIVPTRIELYLQLMSDAHIGLGYGFDDVPTDWMFPADHCYGQYLGSGSLEADGYVSIHAAWAVPTTDNYYYAPRIYSTGGSDNWRYGNVWVWATRVGDI